MHIENSIKNQAYLYAQSIKASGQKILSFWPARKGGNAHANIFRHCTLEYLLGEHRAPGKWDSCEYIRIASMEKLQRLVESAGYTIEEFDPDLIESAA